MTQRENERYFERLQRPGGQYRLATLFSIVTLTCLGSALLAWVPAGTRLVAGIPLSILAGGGVLVWIGCKMPLDQNWRRGLMQAVLVGIGLLLIAMSLLCGGLLFVAVKGWLPID
jgi:hypothetical protein